MELSPPDPAIMVGLGGIYHNTMNTTKDIMKFCSTQFVSLT